MTRITADKDDNKDCIPMRGGETWRSTKKLKLWYTEEIKRDVVSVHDAACKDTKGQRNLLETSAILKQIQT